MQTQRIPFSVRQRLGHPPDYHLASESGCAIQLITEERQRLGIPSCATQLPKEVISLLGTESDSQLAFRFGLTIKLIKAERKALGIPAAGAARPTLPQSTLSKLGTMSDSDLARQDNQSRSAIQKARSRKGIARYSKPKAEISRQTRPWNHLEEWIILALGTMSDCELARQSGRAFSTINNARRIREIPAWGSRALSEKAKISAGLPVPTIGSEAERGVEERLVENSEVLPELDQKGMHILWWATTCLASRSLGISVYTVEALRAAHGIPGLLLRNEPPAELIPELGTCEDLTLANKYGMPARTISKIRSRLGIASFRAQNKPSAKIPPEAFPLLGKFSDSELGVRFGFPGSFFTRARYERGIPRFISSFVSSAQPR
ncbi:hypothetical protein F2S72_09075 [Pseudomonas syringae pv. actinidiae]|nr:hypothetical protein [Pseudomonas syringae pv. actinidiae]